MAYLAANKTNIVDKIAKAEHFANKQTSNRYHDRIATARRRAEEYLNAVS